MTKYKHDQCKKKKLKQKHTEMYTVGLKSFNWFLMFPVWKCDYLKPDLHGKLHLFQYLVFFLWVDDLQLCHFYLTKNNGKQS